jgi:localization factor PodJL
VIDLATAVKWYSMAASNGDAEAMHNVGMMFANGLGVPKSPEDAYHWFVQSSMHGELASQFEVVRRLQEGDGVAPDTIGAYGWLLVLRTQRERLEEESLAEIDNLLGSVGASLDESAKALAETQSRMWLARIAEIEMQEYARDRN